MWFSKVSVHQNHIQGRFVKIQIAGSTLRVSGSVAWDGAPEFSFLISPDYAMTAGPSPHLRIADEEKGYN